MGNDLWRAAGIALTVAVFSVIGLLSGRQVKTKADYYVAGRRFGTISVAATTAGMYIGGGALIGTAQLAFTNGFSGIYFSLGCFLALAGSGLFFSRRIRSGGQETIQEIVRGEYGRTAGALSTLLGLLGFYINCISQFFSGISLVGSILPGSSVLVSSLITAGLILVCVYMGGFLSMSLINVIKGTVLMATVLISAAFILITTHWLADLDAVLPANHLAVFPRGAGTDLGNCLSTALGIMSTQGTIQAIFAAKSDRACKRGFVLGGALLPVVGTCCVLIGMYMRSIAPEISSLETFPQFIIYHTHGLLSGVILATILIAVASAGVSIVLGISSILLNNFYLRLRPEASAKDQLRFSRILIVVILLLTIAIINTGASDSIMQYHFLSMGLRCTVLFLPMCAALFLPGKVSPRFACAAIVAGPLSLLTGKYLLRLPFDSIFFGLAVVTAVMLLGVLDQKRRVRV
jgi:SSS family solute:Na+ symporter